MKRLRDRTDPLSSIEAEAIALLRSAEPYQPATGAKQRVRMRLLSRNSGRPTRFFRPAAVVVSLLLAAGASAAIGGMLVARRYAGTSPGVAQTGFRATEVASNLVSPPAAPAPMPDSSVSSDSLDDWHDEQPLVYVSPSRQTSKAGDRPKAVKSSKAAEVAKPIEAEVAKPTAAKQPEDVKLVFDSMRALRRDGQADLASRQLDEYMRRYPNGTLAEEALALSIEAASVRGDPRAKDLAVRYLIRYPSGRFHKAAERARARFSP